MENDIDEDAIESDDFLSEEAQFADDLATLSAWEL